MRGLAKWRRTKTTVLPKAHLLSKRVLCGTGSPRRRRGSATQSRNLRRNKFSLVGGVTDPVADLIDVRQVSSPQNAFPFVAPRDRIDQFEQIGRVVLGEFFGGRHIGRHQQLRQSCPRSMGTRQTRIAWFCQAVITSPSIRR